MDVKSGILDLREIAAPATPPAGEIRLYSKTDGLVYQKDDAGVETVVTGGGGGGTGTKVSALTAVVTPADTDVFPIVNGGASKQMTLNQMMLYIESRARVNNASVANQAFTTGDTYIAGSFCLIPAGRLQAKTLYRLRMQMTKTSTTGSTATPIINIRVGTAGTTTDSSRSVLTFAAQTAVADTGFFDIYATFRTVGSGTTAVLQGAGLLDHQLAVTGLSTLNTSIARNTGAGFDSTVAAIGIGCSFTGGTSFAGNTDLVQAELLNLA